MKSITSRFVMLIATAAVAPLVAYGVISMIQLWSGTQDSVARGNLGIANQAAARINQYIENNERVLRSIGLELRSTGLEPWQQDRILKDAVLDFREFRELSTFDAAGRPLGTSRLGAPTVSIPTAASIGDRAAFVAPLKQDNDSLPTTTIAVRRERELARQLSARYEDAARPAPADRSSVPRGLERVQLDPDGSSSLHASAIVGLSAQRDQRELATFHLERGRRLFDREQDAEALVELRRAVYLSPYESQAHLLIGRILLRGGRSGEAIDALKISIWSTDSAPAHVALAEAYLKTGNPKGARTELERALAIDPASADARRVLAQIK
jgi:tetratricopeptide (TPR) repeat protein